MRKFLKRSDNMKKKILIVGIFIIFLTLSSAYSFSLFGDDDGNNNVGEKHNDPNISSEIIDSQVTFTDISENTTTTTVNVDNSSFDYNTNTNIEYKYEFYGYVKINLTNTSNPDGNLSDDYVNKLQNYIDNDEFNMTYLLCYDLDKASELNYSIVNVTLDGNILTVEIEGNFTQKTPHQTRFPSTINGTRIEVPDMVIYP